MIRPWQKRRTSKVKSKPRVTAVPNKPFEKQKTKRSYPLRNTRAVTWFLSK